MKKKLALLLSVIMIFMTAVPALALDKSTLGALTQQLAGYDSQTRKSLFENIAVFSGAKENLEMVCGQIDAQSGMVYDVLKPVIEKMGADVTKACLRSIASFGCTNMKEVFYAIADAKTKPEPIALSSKAKAGMSVMLNVVAQNSPEMGRIFSEDGVNESVLAYAMKNIFMNVGDGVLFKYDRGTATFAENAIASDFASSLNAVWAGVDLSGETMTAERLIGSAVAMMNSYVNADDGLKLAEGLAELGLCTLGGAETGGNGGNGTGGNGGNGGNANGANGNDAKPNEQVPAGQFVDLANYPWATESIYSLKEKGIITGTSETTFSPAANIKRGDFILILTRMLGITGGSDNFADVPAGSYYYDAISSAKAAGIAKGDGDHFMPDHSITRQDLITLAYRAFLNKGYIQKVADTSALEVFSDKNLVADYAKEAMASMVSAGIIKGSDGGVNPTGNATRAEVAVMCARLAALMK